MSLVVFEGPVSPSLSAAPLLKVYVCLSLFLSKINIKTIISIKMLLKHISLYNHPLFLPKIANLTLICKISLVKNKQTKKVD